MSEGGEDECRQLEVLQSERNADDGDAEDESEEEVADGEPEAADDNPKQVHEQGQTSGARVFLTYLFAEGPQGQFGEFDELPSEGKTDDGDAEQCSCENVSKGQFDAAEDEPDDIT